MTSVVAFPEIVLSNTVKKIGITVLDADGVPVAADNVALRVFQGSTVPTIWDDLTNGYGETPALPTQILNPDTGKYQFPFGDTSFDSANTTETSGMNLFHWEVTDADGDTHTRVQIVRVSSAIMWWLMEELRLRIDKARKEIDDNPASPCFVGYTNSMLAQFVDGGLSWINQFQPYPMWSSVDSYPDAHWRLLIDAAFFDAMISQEVFAIDTDINYSDQGNSFVIDHQPKIASVINSTWARLVATVPGMKRMYVQSGSARVEMGPHSRFLALMNASAPGSVFRNMFVV